MKLVASLLCTIVSVQSAMGAFYDAASEGQEDEDDSVGTSNSGLSSGGGFPASSAPVPPTVSGGSRR